MSELNFLQKQTSSISELTSTAGNKCEVCGKEVDYPLKETIYKEGRTRCTKNVCEECHEKYMISVIKGTYNIPVFWDQWMDGYIKQERLKGRKVNKTDVVTEGLELFKKKFCD